ncbi:MAG: short-chain dehydrogenase [Cyanobacteria bacterium P01_G01_bin.49]
MDNKQNQLMLNTLEGYENFVNELLSQTTELIADPLLNWEDALVDKNFLF